VGLPWLENVVRAKRPQYLPVVLTRDETRALLQCLNGVPRIMRYCSSAPDGRRSFLMHLAYLELLTVFCRRWCRGRPDETESPHAAAAEASCLVGCTHKGVPGCGPSASWSSATRTLACVGYVLGWPGAHSQGATLDDLRDNLQEVLEMLLENGESLGRR
jgi:hypothetical protein